MAEDKMNKTLSKPVNLELTPNKFADDHLVKLFKAMKRESRVINNLYQAAIPDKIQTEEGLERHKKEMLKHIKSLGYKEAYLNHKISEEDLNDYMNFVKFFTTESKIESSNGLLSNTDSIDLEERALNFLHKMDYSIIKAKFYTIFPLFLHFNKYRPYHAIDMNDDEMGEKIEQYINKIKESKVNQYEKWKEDLDERIKNRVPLNKLQIILEQGKSMKFDVPDYIKETFEKANKFSKELRKILNDKAPLETLLQYQKQSLEYNIITNEMVTFEEGLNRSLSWLEKMKSLSGQNTKIPLKILNSCILEYRNLPLLYDEFKTYKTIYDKINNLLEKMPTLGRISKTRMNISINEKITIKKAREYAKNIEELSVTSEEFEYFLNTLQKAEEHISNIEMFFEDHREDKNYKILSTYLKDLENLPFFSSLQDKLQDYCDYFLIVDRMRKNLTNKLKLSEIINDITICKNRGFYTEEFLDIEKKTNDLILWYKQYDDIFENKTTFKVNDLLFKFDSNVKNSFFSEDTLNNLINSSLNSFIDKQNLSDLIALQDEIKKYKKSFQSKILSIADLINIIKQGLSFNLWSYEFEFMFKRLEFDIRWIINGIKLIKAYHKDYKTHNQPELIEEMMEVVSQKKLVENEINTNSFEFLTKIISNFDESDRLKRTEEYEILKELKKSSEKWSDEVHEILNNGKVLDKNILIGKLEKSHFFPTNNKLTKDLNDILQSYIWFEETKDLFGQNKEYECICAQLEVLDIREMEEDLNKYQALDIMKFNHKEFFKTNTKRLFNLLECIIKTKFNNENPVKMNVLERLISKGKELNFRENQTQMITTFQEFLNKCKNIYDWIRKFNQLINFERKKKIKKNNTKREVELEIKDTSFNLCSTSNILKSSLFGYLKEDKPETSQEKENFEDNKNKMDIERSPLITSFNEKSSMENEEFNILHLGKEENSKGKKSPRTEFKELLECENPLSENKENEEMEEEENTEKKTKKTETNTNSNPGKKFSKIKKNNLIYYFKYPELILLYYKFLKISISIDEQIPLKNYLIEIHSFIQKTNNFIMNSRTHTLEELTALTKIGQNFNCFLLELSYLNNLEKWAYSWINIAKSVLDIMPRAKLFFKSNKPTIRSVLPNNFNPNNYFITFDNKLFEFHVTLKSNVKKSEQSIENEKNALVNAEEKNQEQSEEKNKKYQSKRKKMANRFLQDSTIALYNPKQSFEEEIKGETTKAKKSHKTSLEKLEPKNKKRISIKEYYLKNNLLMEENPEEQFCICRKGYDGFAFMFQCDMCGEWFHGECLSLKMNYIKSLSQYICIGCSKRYNVPYKNEESEFTWDINKKLKYTEFQQLLEEGKSVPLNLQELDEIIEISNKINIWFSHTNVEIGRGIQLDIIEEFFKTEKNGKFFKELEKTLMERDKEIFKLILESIYFPVELEEANHLLLILQKRDFARSLFKYLNRENSLKSMNKFLSKDYKFLNLEDPSCEMLLVDYYHKLKALYEKSNNYTKKLEKLVENKAPMDEFNSLISIVEKETLIIDKLEFYKQNLKEFSSWEQEVSKALNNKDSLEVLNDLDKTSSSKNFICCSIYGERLHKIIDEGTKWLQKYEKYMEEGILSGLTEQELINERQQINCFLPLMNLKEPNKTV